MSCNPIQVGVSLSGDASGYAELPSMQDCCDLCEHTSSCLFFSFKTGVNEPNRCELFSSRSGNQDADPLVVSGAVARAHWLEPSVAACRFTSPEPGTMATAPLARSAVYASREEAQEACLNLHGSCTGVTHSGESYHVRGGSALQVSPTGEDASFKVGCAGEWCD